MMNRLLRDLLGPWLGLPLMLSLAGCGSSTPAVTAPPASEPVVTASPAAEAAATPDLPAMVMSLAQPTVLGTYPSPDGARTAEVTVYDCVPTEIGETLAYDILEIAESPGGAKSVAASQLQYCGGLGAHGLQGLFWSPNSRYFYFTDARTGVPDGGCGAWPGSMARVDIQDGSVQSLGGAVVSPDGTSIASWAADDLVLWSVDKPDEILVPAAISGAVHGPIAWAPDGRALAYVLTTESCPPWGRSTIVLHRLGEEASSILVESETPSFIGAQWIDLDRLRLIEADGGEWTYEISGALLMGP